MSKTQTESKLYYIAYGKGKVKQTTTRHNNEKKIQSKNEVDNCCINNAVNMMKYQLS